MSTERRPWRRIYVPLTREQDDALIRLAGDETDCDYRALVARMIDEGIARRTQQDSVSGFMTGKEPIHTRAYWVGSEDDDGTV